MKYNINNIITDFGNLYLDNLTKNYNSYCINNINSLIINNALLVFLSTSNHFILRNIKYLKIKDKYNNKSFEIKINNIKYLEIKYNEINSFKLYNCNVNNIYIINNIDFIKIFILNNKLINHLNIISELYSIKNNNTKLSNNIIIGDIHKNINKIIINNREF